MTVNLTRIYTRLGDAGETHLGDMSRVPKTHPRIEAYGDIDELNAQIGVALATDGLPERYGEFLRRVQNDLFDAGADLSVPPGGERERLRLRPEQTTWLEERCDEVNAGLAPLRSFVLPGGTDRSAPTSNRSFCTWRSQPAWLSGSPSTVSVRPIWALSSSTAP